MLQKTRHLLLTIPASLPAIVYTDHSATVNISVNTNLRSAATENQNLRLVRAAQFIQTFNLKVYHRSRATNKVTDALSRLQSNMPTKPKEDTDLDNFTQGIDTFPATPVTSAVAQESPRIHRRVFTELSDEIKETILSGYQTDTRWHRVIQTLQGEEASADPIPTKLPYRLDCNGLLYLTYNNGAEALYLPKSITKDIFSLIHDNQAHQGYDRY